MPRQNPAQSARHRAHLAHYKWEFLKRNEDYRRDYEQLLRRHGNELKRAGYPKPESLGLLKDATRKALSNMHYTWGIGFVQNPKNPGLRSNNPFREEHEFSVLSEATILSWDTIRFNNLAVDFRFNWEWIPIAVNLEARPATLHRQLGALLERMRKRTPPRLPPPQPRERPVRSSKQKFWENLAKQGYDLPQKSEKPIRLEATTFDAYLKAWDAHNSGASPAQVAFKLKLMSAAERDAPASWRSMSESSYNKRKAILRRVHRNILEAKNLIAGAYRRIS